MKQAFSRSFVLSLALLLCMGVVVVAQQPTGVLRGQVVDPPRAVIPGATVTVIDAAGQEKTAVTGADGSYTVAALVPGKYTVRVAVQGFSPYENAEVTVAAAERTTLDVQLEVTVEAKVDVPSSGEGVNVEPETNNSGLVLKGRDLEILSDDPDLLVEDLRALAGPGFGPNGTQFYVDGFSGGRLPPKNSIREVRINQNPFAAEQDTLGFGRVEVLTRPGTGQLHGQAFMFFDDESLNARNPLLTSKVPFQVRIFGGNLTGPINKKLSFFADVEKRDIDENAIVSARILDPTLSPVLFSQGVVTPQRRTNFSGRFDYQINQKNTLVGRYGLLRTSLDNQGVGGFSLPSLAFRSKLTEHTVQLTETAIVTPTVLNETRFQFVRSRNQRNGDNSTPTVEVQGAFVGGGSQIGQVFTDTDRYELNNVTTLVSGVHTMRFGGRLRFIDIKDVAQSNFNGRFVFTSLEQYRQVLNGTPGARPAQFIINGGNPQVNLNRIDLGAFFQDDWRMRPNFTLSYGLRFETQNNIGDHVDFAPRISFAWAPFSSGRGTPKTVVRGGIGIFYYRFGEDLTLQADRFNGINQQQVILANPSFFTVVPAFQTLVGSTPQTVRNVDPNLRSPYYVTEAISIERQFPRRSTLSVTYIHQNSHNLLRSRNINAPLPGTFIPGVPTSGTRPFGNVGNIFDFESTGTSRGDGVFINFRTALSNRLNVFVNGRFFNEKTDTDGPFDFPANSYDLSREYGYSQNDVRASTFIGSNIILPWNLAMSAFVRATTGNRFNIITGRDTNGDAVFTERPAFATDLTKPGVVVTRFGAFDPNPGPGQVIIPRNYGRGPSFFNMNVRVGKTFGFGTAKSAGAGPQAAPQPGPPGAFPASDKPYSLTLSFQVQNLLNHRNSGPYIGNLSSPLFGQSNTLANMARQFDFNVRFSF